MSYGSVNALHRRSGSRSTSAWPRASSRSRRRATSSRAATRSSSRPRSRTSSPSRRPRRTTRSASFSNANAAIDLSAPGVGILAAVPPALDTDGVQDGYQALNGTSFSAPMVERRAGVGARRAAGACRSCSVVEAVRAEARRDVERPGLGRADRLRRAGHRQGAGADARASCRPPDPFEPNDNIVWVDGTAFGKKSDPIWSGGAADVARRPAGQAGGPGRHLPDRHPRRTAPPASR